MAKKDERNINVTINNQENNDEVVISISAILRKLKKYFLPWLIVAALIGAMIIGLNTAKAMKSKPPLVAMVSFNYSGIEKGLDPNGRTFNLNDSMKNPAVIEAAVTEQDMDMVLVDKVRQSITIEGIIPSDIIDRLTTYRTLMSHVTNGSVTAAQAILDTKYYPTQFKIYFNYGKCGIQRSNAVQLFNSFLEKYRGYFYEQYGYNKALGVAVNAIDYKDYDYAEAVDLFKQTLSSLKKYVKELSTSDNTHFRSSTGYTFDDLYQSLQTIEDLDVDMITSYVTSNNLTNDREATLSFYAYRIESLNREKDSLNEKIESVKAATEAYKKDTLLIVQNSDGAGTEVTKGSEEYDRLVRQNVSLSSDLAEVKRNINYYTSRKESLEKAPSGTAAMNKRVDEQLAKLDQKVKDITELTRKTAEEYYETVEFANAYNILVPAVNSKTADVSTVIKNSIKSLVIPEVFIFIIYFAAAFIMALWEETKKSAGKKSSSKDDDNDEDDADDEILDGSDNDEEEEEKAEETEEVKESAPAKSASKQNKNKNKGRK